MSAVPNAAQAAGSATSDEVRMLQDAVTTFVARVTDLKRVRSLRRTEPGFDRKLWEQLAEQGWLGVVLPEAYGGTDLGFAAMRAVCEGLGGALIPEPVTACAERYKIAAPRPRLVSPISFTFSIARPLIRGR